MGKNRFGTNFKMAVTSERIELQRQCHPILEMAKWVEWDAKKKVSKKCQFGAKMANLNLILQIFCKNFDILQKSFLPKITSYGHWRACQGPLGAPVIFRIFFSNYSQLAELDGLCTSPFQNGRHFDKKLKRKSLKIRSNVTFLVPNCPQIFFNFFII